MSDSSGGPQGSRGSHYDEVAADYEDAFFYASGPYQEHLIEAISSHMDLDDRPGREHLRVVDIGGGTGNFTAALHAAAALQQPALCVDPFQPMLHLAQAHPCLRTLCMDAVAFSQMADVSYERALLKEVVHHVAAADVGRMYSGLFAQLADGGVAVTVTRPQEVEYPLFQAARQVWRENQPPAEAFTAAMEAAGFTTRTVLHKYKVALSKARWLAMVRARFWSTFSHFTDAELEAGIAELEARHDGEDTLHFHDTLVVVAARKGRRLQEDYRRQGASTASRCTCCCPGCGASCTTRPS